VKHISVDAGNMATVREVEGENKALQVFVEKRVANRTVPDKPPRELQRRLTRTSQIRRNSIKRSKGKHESKKRAQQGGSC
jgi:hypothetical protein